MLSFIDLGISKLICDLFKIDPYGAIVISNIFLSLILAGVIATFVKLQFDNNKASNKVITELTVALTKVTEETKNSFDEILRVLKDVHDGLPDIKYLCDTTTKIDTRTEEQSNVLHVLQDRKSGGGKHDDETVG
jgi:uncharacterized membrane protein YraQ (UPF0718 family)